jgi:membrane-bound metal-dependent hydrolase YbcI (DUF457 family)
VIAGHFGFAAAVKSRERTVPLWALMLACQWLDVIFGPLYAAGIEGLTPIDQGGYGKVIIHADWTHSLLGALVLSALLGAFWRGRTRLVIAAVSFSHWVLDVLVHRADMPLFPAKAGGFPRIGLGLWRWPAAAAAIELALVVVGAALYWRAALETGERRKATIAGAVVLGSGLITLALNLAGL